MQQTTRDPRSLQCDRCGSWRFRADIHRGLCEDCRADDDERAFLDKMQRERDAARQPARPINRHRNPFVRYPGAFSAEPEPTEQDDTAGIDG